MKKSPLLRLVLIALALPYFATAATYTDNFDTSHDYLTSGVTGTIWDGVHNQSAANVLNTTGTAGELTIGTPSSAVGWDSTHVNAPYLYRNVNGDFDVRVQVTAGTTANYTIAGLLVRLNPASADGNAGEDFVMITLNWGSAIAGNGLRSVNDNVQSDGATIAPAQAYLRLTRTGNIFRGYVSTDGTTWTQRAWNGGGLDLARADLGGTVQVGLTEGAFVTGNVTWSRFDNFSLYLPPPAITNQPVAQNAVIGGNASFTVGAYSVLPIGYQWQCMGTNLPGATSDTLVLSNVQTNSAGSYSVMVSNVNGAVASSVVALEVMGIGTLVSDSFNTNHSYNDGGVTGTIWDGVLNYVNLDAQAWATNGVLHWPNTGEGWDGGVATGPFLYKLVTGDFDVEVYTASFSTVAYSDGGLMARNPSTAGGESWITVKIYGGNFADSMRGVVNGGGVANAGMGNGKPYLRLQRVGSTFNCYSKTNSTDSWGTPYTVTRADLPAQLQVGLQHGTFIGNAADRQFDNFWLFLPAPTITTQPLAQKVLPCNTATFTVGASGKAPFTYQWQRSSTNIPGATAATFALTNVQFADASTFRVIVTDAYGASVTSSNAVLEVYAAWTDDFSVFHSYNGGDVTGTIWDGVLNYANLDASSDTTGGVLHWQNTGEGWEAALATGPFLYKTVRGDFDAQIYVPYFSGVSWSDGGLMARNPNAAGGENWVSVKVFGSGGTDGVRWSINGGNNNATIGGLNRYLRLQRIGTTFYCSTKANAGDAWGAPYTVVRPDLPNALQVGLWHGTFGSTGSDRQYDDFLLINDPTITNQPVSQKVLAGATVNLSVGAKTGAGTLLYQWRLNGTDLVGATGATLTLSNVQPASSGSYTVLLTDTNYAKLSAVAVLEVYPAWTDDFATSHNFAGGNVVGTMWDGFLFNFANGNATLGAADANLSNAGRLTLRSSNGDWSGTNDDGAFLFKTVTGDFIATVQVAAMDNNQWNDAGLMARVASLANGGVGEDWVAVRECPIANVSGLRNTDNGVSSDLALADGLQSWLRLVRSGDIFAAYRSTNGIDWSEIGSVSRTDLSGLPLQVGLWQATFSANEGVAQFDNFALATPPVVTNQPVPQVSLVGGTASFSVGAAGAGTLSYQWQFNGTNLAGATNATLTLTNVQFSQAGNYQASVADSNGPALSVPVPLEVFPFGLLAGDDFNAYHDYSSGDVSGTIWDGILNAANLDPASDTTNGVLHLRNTGEGWDGGWTNGPFLFKTVRGDFDAQVYVPYFSTINWSDGGLIARVPVSVSGENWASAKINGPGSAAGVRWAANGTVYNLNNINGALGVGMRYLRMQRVGTAFNLYSKVAASDPWNLGCTLSLPAMTDPLEVGLWHGTFSATAADRQYDNFWLWVSPAPMITSQPQNQVVPLGGTANFNVAATNSVALPLSYQWFFGPAPITDATNATLTLTNASPAQDGSYFVVVANSSGSVTSSVAMLIVTDIARGLDNLVISEFMAANHSTLADEDGEYSDWLEIYNAGTNTVNLGGWYLTDNAGNLTKWSFPATNLNAGSYLVVFASNKNRRVPGAPLHTNFKLSSSGQFLGLIRPDGITIVSAYSPTYPPQVSDVAFGVLTATRPFTLVSADAPVRVLVPSDGSLGQTWIARAFDDSSWLSATNGVGYEAPYAGTTQGLAGAWSFNVSGSLGMDSSSNNNTLTPQGSAAYSASGQIGGALSLNGTSDYLSAAVFPQGVPTNNSSYTVAAWIKPTATGSKGIIGWGNYGTDSSVNAFRLNGANGFSHYWWGNDAVADATTLGINLTDGQWHHAAAVYDGTNRSMWLDGLLLTSSQPGTPNNAQPLNFRIGQTYPGEYFQGLLDEVAVWNLALSSEQITALAGGATALTLPPSGYVSIASLIKTSLQSQMQNLRSSAFVRVPFSVTNAAQLGRLTLRMRYNDGFVAYVNGTEVARRNTPTLPAYDSTATASRSRNETITPEEIDLTPYLALLQDGTNILAVHGLNALATDSEFLLIPELEASERVIVQTNQWLYFATSTPGQPNYAGSTLLGAVVSDAQFTPQTVASTNDIVVTARIRTTVNPVSSVTLRYRVMFGAEVPLPMFDDGAHGDSAAGDGIYGATIPAGVAAPGQMVRWYVSAVDSAGTVSRWPLFYDPAGSPQYFGTVIANPAIATQIPVFQYFIENTNWYKLPNNGPYDQNDTNACVYYLGRFYDNVRVRIRGASSVIWKFPKQSLKFDFNLGDHFVFAADRDAAAQINVNEFWTDKAYVRNQLAMSEIYRAAGVPSQDAFFLLTYLNSDLHSVASFVEEPDDKWLRRLGLDSNGALYKMYNPCNTANIRPPFIAGVNPDTRIGAEKKTRTTEDFSDLQAFIDGIKVANPNRSVYLFDNVNLPEVINYFAASVFVQDWDRYSKNHFVYRDTDGTREWQIMPWDADLSLGYLGWMTDNLGATHATLSHPLYGESDFAGPGGWHVLADALYRTPAIELKLEARLDALYALAHAEVEADKLQWGVPFGTNQTFQQAIDALKNDYLAPRRTNLFVTHCITNGGLIPLAQPGNAVIQIAAVEFNPASGNQAEEYFCLTNPNPFAVDISGWQISGGVQLAFQPGTVMPSNSTLYASPNLAAFRARATSPRSGESCFVVGNYSGQLSARGETLVLTDNTGRAVTTNTYAGSPSLAQQYLRITELMYHPPAGVPYGQEEYEYIELKNISATETLELNGVKLTNGVEFAFTVSTLLLPGQRLLLVKNQTAFEFRYGTGLPIGGTYTGSLDNAGERLTLLDAVNEEVLDFSYNNSWYPITDGLGFSLVVVNENAEPDTWNNKSQWRSSGTLNGSPGTDDAVPTFAPVVINEVLSASGGTNVDAIELYNPASTNVDVGGWFLTDAYFTPKKFRIPDNTTIPAGGYVVFTEADFNTGPNAFALSSTGDDAWLFSGDALGNLTGYSHGFSFGAADTNVTFGRYVNSVGEEHFVAQSANTLGTSNAYPQVGPLVVTEIMYHPPDVGTNDNQLHDFIELQNISGAALALFDPAQPTNIWRLRGGVDYEFPTNVTLAAHSNVVVVSFDPTTDPTSAASFRTHYGLSVDVPLFGPYRGKLNNDTDTIEVQKPSAYTNAPYILVEAVHYRDAAPWPAAADGTGQSLRRLHLAGYANDPTNWVAAAPSPGATEVLITGQVQLEYFVGANRAVTFAMADGAGFTTRSTPTLNFAGGVASYTVWGPPGAVRISAKTAWNLRKMLGVTPANGEATANFTSGKALPAGDLDGSNVVDLGDYFILAGAWYQIDFPADLDGSGFVDLDDYFLLSNRWNEPGESE